MVEKFNKLDGEKQKCIIHAALIEFADKGYEHASTNQIVKQAGIGKGMLFYYFNSKQELYNYLMNYSFDILINNYLSLINEEMEDFIDHLKQITRIKFNYFTEHQEVNQFLGRLVLLDGMSIPDELKQKYEATMAIANAKVYGRKNFDHSLLRDDINPEKAYQLLEWSVKGYQNDLLQRFKGQKLSEIDLPSLWKEFDEYLAILKITYFK